MTIFIGIDVGTSACRACAIDAAGRVLAEARTGLPAPQRDGPRVWQDADTWWGCLCDTLDSLNRRVDPQRVRRIAVDGTSATLLMCRPDGTPLSPGLMYNDTSAAAQLPRIAAAAPANSAVLGAGSSLAKFLQLRETLAESPGLALHQADWLAGRLSGRFGYSDENNTLKLGYDAVRRCWPDWLRQLDIHSDQLPRVKRPGTVVGTVDRALGRRWGWPGQAEVAIGTTDSTAGFIATGARDTGTAVTALGSTLVLKVLSDRPVFVARYGVYSHRLGDRWLVGGASSAGGATLRQWFSDCDIRRFTRLLVPDRPTGLDYYPLPAPGERFPFNDPDMQPRLQPRPTSDARFFQAILEGLAHIEKQGYELLAQLGAPYPQRIITVGGGARNAGWTRIRQRLLGVPVTRAQHEEAAYGTALLARGL